MNINELIKHIESINKSFNQSKIYISFIKTSIGEMIAIANEHHLNYLNFINTENNISLAQKSIESKISNVSFTNNNVINLLIIELESYFQSKLKEFTVPLLYSGTNFQKKAWKFLTKIKYGETRTYKQQAENIGAKSAYRAVANTNSANKISILIPCHRIINSSGKLGGYNGGIHRKKFLLEHEQNFNLPI